MIEFAFEVIDDVGTRNQVGRNENAGPVVVPSGVIVVVVCSRRKWAYMRIIAGTIVGGVLGFYVMHRVELGYKEKMKERLKQYENELKKKEQMKELEDSL